MPTYSQPSRANTNARVSGGVTEPPPAQTETRQPSLRQNTKAAVPDGLATETAEPTVARIPPWRHRGARAPITHDYAGRGERF
jgi:hypothetical protein